LVQQDQQVLLDLKDQQEDRKALLDPLALLALLVLLDLKDQQVWE
jgi:hypothetical protein